MNTREINSILHSVPGFVGTFPCNFLKSTNKRPALYVINTAKLSKRNLEESQNSVVPGKHWVVLIIKKDGKAEYFDSYGFPPTQPDIVRFIEEHSKQRVKWSTQMLQDPLSRVCGVYCVDYIQQRSSGVAMKQYLAQFTTDTQLNDQKVVERVTCRLSAQRPSLLLNLKSLLT